MCIGLDVDASGRSRFAPAPSVIPGHRLLKMMGPVLATALAACSSPDPEPGKGDAKTTAAPATVEPVAEVPANTEQPRDVVPPTDPSDGTGTGETGDAPETGETGEPAIEKPDTVKRGKRRDKTTKHRLGPRADLPGEELL